ncbi:NAD-dependent epimerase/dehydratase family protein [Ornithinibacillus californiensis]|uniref:NAD-dependent epimerase/dehydratase family protein n=1 Tax=Ornithinibacillus californiensis TaxID=161536 RepID=UPI00064D8613|nr:NAD-dependent epimerase/dehydratase family protein [Ornithinibacillus californiensis]
MQTIAELEEIMTKPSQRLIDDLKQVNGDIMILGVGGKMGPTLAKLAKRAVDEAGLNTRIIGVSRFSSGNLQEELETSGIETIACDLLNEEELNQLPSVKNVIFMAGKKFGTMGNEHFTWAMNTYLPGRVAEKFADSNIIVFSSGNIYPFVDITKAGCTEETPTQPVGEYAQSCLGRERVFTYLSKKNNTPILLYRLNYAIDMRYGVLLEIAKQVFNDKPVDLTTGHVNVIWQGDANEYALRSLLHCSTDPAILNITGPETISVRWLAEEFGRHFNKEVTFVNSETPTALLNNAGKAHKLFGYPSTSLQQMVEWTADWLKNDGQMIDKPTHFQERQGAF